MKRTKNLTISLSLSLSVYRMPALQKLTPAALQSPIQHLTVPPTSLSPNRSLPLPPLPWAPGHHPSPESPAREQRQFTPGWLRLASVALLSNSRPFRWSAAAPVTRLTPCPRPHHQQHPCIRDRSISHLHSPCTQSTPPRLTSSPVAWDTTLHHPSGRGQPYRTATPTATLSTGSSRKKRKKKTQKDVADLVACHHSVLPHHPFFFLETITKFYEEEKKEAFVLPAILLTHVIQKKKFFLWSLIFFL